MRNGSFTHVVGERRGDVEASNARRGNVNGANPFNPLDALRHVRGCDRCGQATKGMWGMSWRQKAMKGVEDCDKPGETVKQVLIPGSPNRRALNP